MLREKKPNTNRLWAALGALGIVAIVGVWGYGMYTLPGGQVIQRVGVDAEAPPPPSAATTPVAASKPAPPRASATAAPKAREAASPELQPTPVMREQVVRPQAGRTDFGAAAARSVRPAGPVRPGLAPPELRFETSEDVNDGVVYSASDHTVDPPTVLYPQELGRLPRAIRRDDMALIEVVINEDGTVAQAKAQEAPRTLDDAMMVTMSLSAAKSWRFQPAQKDGRAVRYRQTIPVTIR